MPKIDFNATPTTTNTRKLEFDNEESTQFSRWLRNQPELDSHLGFRTNNIDYPWQNWKTNQFLLLEEKRKMKEMTDSQRNQFIQFDYIFYHYNNDLYKGFHLIQFENTNPDDGKIFLDKKEISKEILFKFLKFEADEELYSSYFKKFPIEQGSGKFIYPKEQIDYLSHFNSIFNFVLNNKTKILEDKFNKKLENIENKIDFIIEHLK